MRVSAKFHLKMDLIAMWECLRMVVSIMKNGLVMVDGLGEGRWALKRVPSRISVIRNPITINNAPRNPFW